MNPSKQFRITNFDIPFENDVLIAFQALNRMSSFWIKKEKKKEEKKKEIKMEDKNVIRLGMNCKTLPVHFEKNLKQ